MFKFFSLLLLTCQQSKDFSETDSLCSTTDVKRKQLGKYIFILVTRIAELGSVCAKLYSG